MIKVYKKLPVLVEAVVWNGKNKDEIKEFCGDKAKFRMYAVANTGNLRKFLLIQTLEGMLTAQVGDYIIKGVNGEFYPCKSEIFKRTYKEEIDLEEK